MSFHPVFGAGVLLTTPDGRGLFLRRSNEKGDFVGYWDIPGGGANVDEDREQTAVREMVEEIGARPYGEREEVAQTALPETPDFSFTTFRQPILRPFTPRLCDEHDGYVWARLDEPPRPLHPGLERVLGILQQDRNKVVTVSNVQANDSAMALDRASVRRRDQDGRLYVDITNISKAAVNPYKGSEIPDNESLGLDPNKVYKLLRHPDELEKAASTFNNLPLLDVHIPVTVDDPQQEHVIGSTGTDAAFEAPYLRNSLVVWTAAAIEGIESGEQQEISCGYYYVADMTPGEYEGEPYDGVMREIRGNHVALVAAGRAGPDVVVGDSILKLNQETVTMSKPRSSRKAALVKGALLALLAHKKLAADAMPDLDKMLAGVQHKNYLDKKPGIVAALRSHKALAKDEATIGEVVSLLDRLDGEEPMDDVATDSPAEAVLAMLRGKLSDEDLGAVEAKLRECMGGAAGDADPDDDMEPDPDNPGKMRKKAALAGDAPTPTEGSAGDPKDVVTVGAMDAAITTAVAKERKAAKIAMDAAVKKAAEDATKATLKLAQDIAMAEEEVRPYVGRLAMAFDSVEGVYKAALDTMKIATEGIHPSAYKAILAAQPKPGARREVVIAADAEPSADFSTRFPEATRLINA